ncbi:Nn.00g003570.m01.CDS01 [Neocucurbitaria sp. VM-36]
MGIAPIESLPVELLQPIFFASGYNVTLLKASTRIGAQLSSEYVYSRTCNHHLTRVLDDRSEQSAAQTYIFASKWMTWAFFKSWITRRFGPKGCLCDLSPDDGCFDAQWPPDFEDATRMVFSRSHLPRLAFIKGRIPKKLLHGAWTQDKIQFLRFILWITSMTVDWSDPETRQIAIHGRYQAMSQRNLEAVELFNHNRRLGKVASLPILRFAVMEAGCDRSIVYDTLLTANMWGMRGSSWDCIELDEWCQIRIEEGDPKGQWLRTKLEELRAFSGHEKRNGEDTLVYRRVSGFETDAEAGNYDGGTEDRLVVHKLEWNKVSTITFPLRLLYW